MLRVVNTVRVQCSLTANVVRDRLHLPAQLATQYTCTACECAESSIVACKHPNNLMCAGYAACSRKHTALLAIKPLCN